MRIRRGPPRPDASSQQGHPLAASPAPFVLLALIPSTDRRNSFRDYALPPVLRWEITFGRKSKYFANFMVLAARMAVPERIFSRFISFTFIQTGFRPNPSENLPFIRFSFPLLRGPGSDMLHNGLTVPSRQLLHIWKCNAFPKLSGSLSFQPFFSFLFVHTRDFSCFDNQTCLSKPVINVSTHLFPFSHSFFFFLCIYSAEKRFSRRIVRPQPITAEQAKSFVRIHMSRDLIVTCGL